ncbi:MAG: ABC transporter permease subunit [Actinobacteria bacterium]|uniref:Unannotated protein n=1 Tax=freshwater metagenome TaxID=449393 RepID=A0A6J6QQB6_9ZZZZ|nr:ABC transporter permease subunit [Actinomycetota bacterium]
MKTFSVWLYQHRRGRLALLLTAPMLWLVVAYLGSLATMLVSAFWSVDTFTGKLVKQLTFNNFSLLFTNHVYRDIALRSIVVALLVTVIDGLLALPIALFLAKVLPIRFRNFAVVLIVLPLWSSYLVKTYAWRTMFSNSGVLAWALKPLGVTPPSYGLLATTLTLAYLWLPYMILPIYAGLERIPDSLLEASGDLGASAGKTFQNIVMPILYPAVIAGSIFTFSLSLGDYIVVKIVGGKTQLFANVIYDNIGTAGNLPFAAAAAIFPIVTVLGYLFFVRRSGALENF